MIAPGSHASAAFGAVGPHSGIARVLVAYDGGAGALCVLSELSTAALSGRVEALVVTVADRRFRSPGSVSRADAGLRACSGAAALRSALPGWAVTHEVAHGPVVATLVACARRFEADLVVVGAQTRRDRLPGEDDVAAELLAAGVSSLRVCRSSLRTCAGGSHVLAGYDGSRASESALRSAMSRAWRDGTEIRVVAVPSGRRTQEDLRPRCAATGAIGGVRTALAIREGELGVALQREAGSWCADVVFVGDEGPGSAPGRRVASALVERAPCSVEVVLSS